MEAGEVIRWSFVQADGRIKLRPALLLKKLPPFNDWVICAISSQTQRFQPEIDVLINEQHSDFRKAGLSYPSIIRSGYLSTIPSQQIEGRMGIVSPTTVAMVRRQLADWIRT